MCLSKWSIGNSSRRTVCLVVSMVLYVLLGGGVCYVLGYPEEESMRRNLRHTRELFIRNNDCIPDEELEAFIREIIHANNRGVSAIGNVTSEPNWSFGQSIFFAGTVLTTIGYGHVTPLSEGGKIFCIVYALIGIPLTLIMFTALVERLMILTGKLLQLLGDRLGHLYRAFSIRLIHLTLVAGSLVLFILFLPAAIFSYLEQNWNYLDAFYYCFISMTTIGLGDYIPGDKPDQSYRAVYKIITTVYLFLGLILMMLLLATVYDVPELNIGFHFYLKSDEDEEERKSLNTPGNAGPKYTEQIDEPPSKSEQEQDH